MASVKRTMAGISPDIVVRTSVLSERIQESLLRERLIALLSGFFGLLASLLAAVGLYGIIAYTVTRRQHEIGLRIALGAGTQQVIAMVLKESLVLLGVGLPIGIVLAMAAAHEARALLFGVAPHDPATFAVGIGVLVVLTLAASWLPAARASRVDPSVALRSD
jgi:ABC-type antimicrobial peptide transport system permease subunit